MKYLEQHSLLRTPLSGSIHLTDSLTKKSRQFNRPYYAMILPELIKKILNQSISELPYLILLYKPVNEIPSLWRSSFQEYLFIPDSPCVFLTHVCFTLMTLLGQISQQKTTVKSNTIISFIREHIAAVNTKSN